MEFIYTAKQIKNDMFQFTVTFLLRSLINYILEISLTKYQIEILK